MEPGYFSQSVREYKMGLVTLDGKNLDLGKTSVRYNEAYDAEKQGYAEFLHNKFGDGKAQMRRLVSYMCGMADSIGGVIYGMVTDGEDIDRNLLKGKPKIDLMQDYANGTVSVQAKEIDPEIDNYDIHIADNGDVTIKMKTVIKMRLTDFAMKPAPLDEKGEIAGLSETFTFSKDSIPEISAKQYTATIFIKNQTDEQLQGKMPEFEIKDFAQAVY